MNEYHLKNYEIISDLLCKSAGPLYIMTYVLKDKYVDGDKLYKRWRQISSALSECCHAKSREGLEVCLVLSMGELAEITKEYKLYRPEVIDEFLKDLDSFADRVRREIYEKRVILSEIA